MEHTSRFSLNRIGQIAIRVTDVERASTFYRDALGMPVLFAAGGIVFHRCGDVTLMLTRAEAPEFDHPASVLYFPVDDIGRAYDALAKRGVRFRGEPHIVHRAPDHELWMAFFYDADDNTLAMMQQKRTVAA